MIFLLLICISSTITIYKIVRKNLYIINNNLSHSKKNIQVEKVLELAKIYIHQKRWLSCIIILEKNVTTKDKFVAIYYNNIGFCYYSLKIYTLSEYYYHKAFQEKPADIVTLCNLGQVYKKNKKYKQAITMYQKVLQLENSNHIAQKELKILLKT